MLNQCVLEAIASFDNWKSQEQEQHFKDIVKEFMEMQTEITESTDQKGG